MDPSSVHEATRSPWRHWRRAGLGVDEWTSLALFVGFVTLYALSIDLHAPNVLWHNFVFDADIDRVTADATARQDLVAFGRHPLFTLVVAAPATALSWFGLDVMASLRLLVACVGALGVVGVRILFQRITGECGAALVFAVLYGLSATTWLLSSIPETFAFNATAIVACFLMHDPSFARPRERPGRFAGFVLVSALAVGVTVSNAAYVALACLSNVRRAQPTWRRRIEVIALAYAGVAVAFVGLSIAQKVCLGRAVAHDTGVVSPLEAASGDAFLDFGRALSIRDALSVARAFLVDNLVAPGSVVEVVRTVAGQAQMIQYGQWRAPTYVAAVVALAVLCAGIGATAGRSLARSHLAQLAFACVVFNLSLHYFYRANGQPFIFTIHTVLPVLVLLVEAYARSGWSPRRWLAMGAVAAVGLNNGAFVGTVRNALAVPCSRKVYLVCTSWATDGVGARYTRGLAAYMDSAEYLSDQGMDAIDRGNAPEAEQFFRAALARSPDMLTAERGLAVSLVLLGRSAEAVVFLRRVVERDPGDNPMRELLDQLGHASGVNPPLGRPGL